eukprot:1121607-Rhodomonas_salina.2
MFAGQGRACWSRTRGTTRSATWTAAGAVGTRPSSSTCLASPPSSPTHPSRALDPRLATCLAVAWAQRSRVELLQAAR